MYNEVPSLFLIVFFGNLHSVSPVHYNTFGLQAPSLISDRLSPPLTVVSVLIRACPIK